ncbi:MAG: hypothetical protein Q9218_000339 [Villophora microphyllina]
MTSTTSVTEVPITCTNHQNHAPLGNGEISLRDLDQRPLGNTRQGNDLSLNALERWNRPRINKYRLAAVFFAFLNFGMNDGSYGALVPYITAYAVIATHPPYPAVVTILALAGLGNGIVDAAWNAWIGSLAHTNQLLGLMHGFYGLGATISPLIATTMITKSHLGWWTFFYLMAGLAAIEIVTGATAFWPETGTKYTENNRADGEDRGMTRESLKQRVTWICAVFLLCYVGLEGKACVIHLLSAMIKASNGGILLTTSTVSLGGWIVNFMIRVRKGEPFQSGMTATGFWLGIAAGRVILGFITPRVGERLAVSIYLLVAVGFELIFWLVPQFIVSAVAVALLGFFIGPIFPSTIIAVTKLLPSEMHVAAIGFSAAIGGGGAAVYVDGLAFPSNNGQ